jgi:DNA gyrase subunit A
VCDSSKTLLVATENGYGKRTSFDDYRQTHRGGMGVTAIKGADRNGRIVAAHAVSEDESIISITSDAQMVRSPVRDIGVYGRSAQGVRLVRLSEGAKLVSVSVCESEDEAKEELKEAVAEGGAPAAEDSPAAEETPTEN